MEKNFLGYRRANGKVGVRNHVLLLPVEDAAISVCQSVAALIPGTLAAAHCVGRDQFDADEQLHFDTLIGLGSNPNVAAVIVVGYKSTWTDHVAQGISAAQKPVAAFSIDGVGDLKTVNAAAFTAQRFLQDASELQRVSCSLADLCLASKCGETDVTSLTGTHPAIGNVYDKLYALGATLIVGETTDLEGGKELVFRRCANDEVRHRFENILERYTADLYSHLSTTPKEELLLTKSLLKRGLTTLEERSMGSLLKIGDVAPIIGVLEKGEMVKGPGLWFLDSGASNAEMGTLAAAAGCTVMLCATGTGGGPGNIITPTMKITSNARTAQILPDQIDVDLSALVAGDITLEEAGDRLLTMVQRTASGRLTAAETLGHKEMYITRLYQSR